MPLFRNTRTGDVITAEGPVATMYGRRPDWEEYVAPESADTPDEELKGAALDQALEDAGLPKSGSADEKRARLAEHQANTPA